MASFARFHAALLAVVLTPVPGARLDAAWFIRGDVNASGTINVTDAVQLIRFLFLGDTAAVGCPDAADADNDGKLTVTDGIYLLSYLFQSGPAPAVFRGCFFHLGGDRLGCESFGPCSPLGLFLIFESSAAAPRWGQILIQPLLEEDEFALTIFSEGLVGFPASDSPASATPAAKAEGILFLAQRPSGSGACSKPALAAALSYANRSSAKTKAIIYIANGLGPCPAADPETYREEALSLVAAGNKDRIPIHVFSSGGDRASEAWLRKLAAQNGGTYLRIQG